MSGGKCICNDPDCRVKQTRDERRKIADEAHQEARLLWQRGREDRMAERPMDPLFRINLYYRTAYEGERRKEVRRHADK